MGIIKTKSEQKAIIESGKRLASVFAEIDFAIIVGKTTKEVDIMVKRLLDKYELSSTAYGYHGFTGYSCISLNDVVVHGVPAQNLIIGDEDLVKVDICARHKGYCADMARPYFAKNNPNQIIHKLVECGWQALERGFSKVKDKVPIGTMAYEIESEIVENGFSVVTQFTGHGIGKSMHEEPAVPNWGEVGKGQMMFEGMALAVEPMFCEKRADLVISSADKWSARTKDGGLACHIEDTIIVGRESVFIATRL